jgi:voltage-gated potassium channel
MLMFVMSSVEGNETGRRPWVMRAAVIKVAIQRLREPAVTSLGRGRLRHVYDWGMISLALAVAWMLTLPDDGWVNAVNLAIWAIFVFDYAARLLLSTDRRMFLRRNIPDLIAIIPLDFFRLARLARLGRLVRLVRAGTLFWRATSDMRGVLGTNGLSYVLVLAVGFVFGGSLLVMAVEDGLDTFGDALWWSVVTATTVGYGDIAPENVVARLVAVVLMLVGIGTLGMVTGAIATYFIRGRAREETDPDLEHVRDRLGDWNDLSPRERMQVAALLNALAHTPLDSPTASP